VPPPETGVYDVRNLDWTWTDTLGTPNIGLPPSAAPPDGVGFGPPWYLTSMNLFYQTLAETVLLTIAGTSATYGPTSLAIPSGPDGLTVPFDTPLELDADSVITASGDGAEVGSDIFLSLASSLAPSIPADGVPAGDGTNPQMIMQRSNDGGKTWSAEQSVSMGKIGDYQRLAKWSQNGRSNNRSFRVICSEPVDASLVAADLDAVPGT
jgi:hypothetical protein